MGWPSPEKRDGMASNLIAMAAVFSKKTQNFLQQSNTFAAPLRNLSKEPRSFPPKHTWDETGCFITGPSSSSSHNALFLLQSCLRWFGIPGTIHVVLLVDLLPQQLLSNTPLQGGNAAKTVLHPDSSAVQKDKQKSYLVHSPGSHHVGFTR